MADISLLLNYGANDPRRPSYLRYVEAMRAYEASRARYLRKGLDPKQGSEWQNVVIAQQQYVFAKNLYAENYNQSNPDAGATPGGDPLFPPAGSGGGSQGGGDPADPNRLNAIEYGKQLLRDWGLSGMEQRITDWVTAGYSGEALASLIRQSDEYRIRFPAMATLSENHRAISEAEYIAFERQMAEYENYYGLSRGFLSNYVTELLSNDVSAKEVNDRLQLNMQAAYQAPPEVREALSRLYGVDIGRLTEYYLQSDKALPELQREWASAQVAGAGDIMGFEGLMGPVSERLADMGVSYASALQGFAQAARDRSLTRGFGTTVTGQDSLIYGEFGVAEDAAQIERARRAKINAFRGGGEAYMTQEGVIGAGSANT